MQATDQNGFEQICAGDPTALLPAICDKFNPDIAVISCGDIRRMVRHCLERSLPALIYFRDVEFGAINWRIPVHASLAYLANSQFVAQAVRVGLGLRCDVIHSLIDPSRYRVNSTRERVLFVNPLPKKGVHIALALARAFPSIPFTFVEGWVAPPADHDALARACAEAGNIELAAPTDDMRHHYGRARILLVPSVWEEAFPRVVTEAQLNGIPVIASRRGGLPEAVGPGGIIEELSAPAERWSQHLSRLWNDAQLYDTLSRAALQHASRAEMAEETITHRFMAKAEALVDAQRRSQRPRGPALVGIASSTPARQGQAKVFGIGLGRTGTTTLTRALRLLGYSAIHYPMSLDQIHAHDAATDSSVAANFEALDGLFPGSRFIWTVRPIEPWLGSCERHYSRRSRVTAQMASIRLALHGRADFNRADFMRAHANHETRVRRYFATRPGDLLEIDLSSAADPWIALCSFLGRARPDAPFPWLNRSSHVEALAFRLCGLVGGTEPAARLFNLSPAWLDAVMKRQHELADVLEQDEGDDGTEFSNLLNEAVKHLGGVAAAAKQLRLSEAVVEAAIDRVRGERRQHGLDS